MPTYQYACTNPDCGNRFELVQSFTDPAARECPVCGQQVRKVYGSVGVVFKGSGFYRTDSRADSRAAAKASTTSESDSKSKSESSSDTSSKAETKKTEPAKAASGSGSGSSTKAAASA